MRAYRGRVFRLDAHLERLYASAKTLQVNIRTAPAELGRRLIKTLAASGVREAMVRVALIPDAHRRADASIVVQPVPAPSTALYRRGIRVAVVPTRKFPIAQITPQAKFSNRLGSVLAILDVQLRQVDEAIFMDEMGLVTESTASNLAIVKHGTVLTPPCAIGLLSGITRQVVLELADASGIPSGEIPLTRHDLYNADEACLLSTLKEVLPVTSIDGRAVGTGKPGPVSRRLHRAFQALVRRELYEHH